MLDGVDTVVSSVSGHERCKLTLTLFLAFYNILIRLEVSKIYVPHGNIFDLETRKTDKVILETNEEKSTP